MNFELNGKLVVMAGSFTELEWWPLELGCDSSEAGTRSHLAGTQSH